MVSGKRKGLKRKDEDMHAHARSLGRFAGLAPVALRFIVGGMMFFHGLDKLTAGPAGFGQFLQSLGLPAGVALGWAVTMLELVGGALLVFGLFSRVVAALLIVNLIGAIIYVSGEAGLIAAEGVGYERDLAYIAGFIGVVLLGPGRPSLDHAFGIEKHVPALVSAESSAEGTRTSVADHRQARA